MSEGYSVQRVVAPRSEMRLTRLEQMNSPNCGSAGEEYSGVLFPCNSYAQSIHMYMHTSERSRFNSVIGWRRKIGNIAPRAGFKLLWYDLPTAGVLTIKLPIGLAK